MLLTVSGSGGAGRRAAYCTENHEKWAGQSFCQNGFAGFTGLPAGLRAFAGDIGRPEDAAGAEAGGAAMADGGANARAAFDGGGKAGPYLPG
jgi:hypothetical protein